MYSHWTLEVDNPPGFQIYKLGGASFIERDQPFSFQLHYSVVGSRLYDLRIIDILPHNNDGHSPASDFSGSLHLVGVTLPANDPLAVSLYTRNAPGNIDPDPYAASNAFIDGTGANGPSRTVWCIEAQFGTGNCPQDLAQVTAILIVTNPDLLPDVEYMITLALQPEGNADGDVYTNAYSAGSPDFAAPLVSNDVPVRVVSGGLSGFVYLDNNNNGIFDQNEGEFGLPDVMVTLTCTEGPNCTPGTAFSALTGSDGAYAFVPGASGIFAGNDVSGDPLDGFLGLLSGTWQVTESQPEGFIDGLDTPGSLGGVAGDDVIDAITLPAGGNGVNYNFGERQLGLLGDRVWADFDQDGFQDPDEPGLPDVTLTLEGDLLGGGSLSRTTQSGPDGFYQFLDLPYGSYSVRVSPASLPAGFDIQTYDLDGLTSAHEAAVSLTETDPDRDDVDFGYASDAVLSSVSGTVYFDRNNNGLIEAGEPGIPDVTVTLECIGGPAYLIGTTYTTRTDASGAYGFAPDGAGTMPMDFPGVPAGTWRIVETQPEAYEDGLETPGNLGGVVGEDTFTLNLPAGTAATDYNFGEWIFIEPEIVIPQTGFAPGGLADGEDAAPVWVPPASPGLILRIPAIDLVAPVVGVPFQPETQSWDVRWLQDVGWLAGTAFPTWDGRTVLTAHNLNPAGYPGPFHDLADLAYGDRIEIHFNGLTVVYQVTGLQIVPDWDSSVMFQHSEQDLLVLVTCTGEYQPEDGYKARLVIEAVRLTE
jgi:LPXTG-site transpeptidase (sortase) family protein